MARRRLLLQNRFDDGVIGRIDTEISALGFRPLVEPPEFVVPGPIPMTATIPDNAVTVVDLTDVANWKDARLADIYGSTGTDKKVLFYIEGVLVRVEVGSETEAVIASLFDELTMHHKRNNDDFYWNLGQFAGTVMESYTTSTTANNTTAVNFARKPIYLAFDEPILIDCENDTWEVYARNAVNFASGSGCKVHLLWNAAAIPAQYGRPDVQRYPANPDDARLLGRLRASARAQFLAQFGDIPVVGGGAGTPRAAR